MPDYIFLLESRLSPEQRAALERVQELARAEGLNIYLTGGAVRDLISGQPIRDLDFTVEGNPARMVRELEKGGAKVAWESERLRHYEMIFAGDADGSISGARDEVYDRPGARPELRFSSIMEDLRRRDFSINAIAISLNLQSGGLLLDPTNGLADLERQELRVLSIHAFTNQPIRLLRILRYCARMGFKMESRTQEWFELAMERGLAERIEGGDVGHEIRALARDDSPVPALKAWEARGLLTTIHPQLQRRKPDYESLNRLARARANFLANGMRLRLQAPVTYYLLRRLKSREASAALHHMEFRSAEIDAIARLLPDAQKISKALKGRATAAARDAYFFIASVPPEMLAFLEVEMPHPRAMAKVRNYMQKWRPMRLALPIAELDALGIPRGARFDKILEQLFELQLRGRARAPEDRAKALRQLAGIKEQPAKKPEKLRKRKEGATSPAPAAKLPEKSAEEAAHPAAPPAPEKTGAEPEKGAAAPRKGAKPSRAARPKHARRPARKSRRR